MNGEERVQVIEVLNSIQNIMKRFDEYEKYLHYPGEWGERAFRAWLVFEIFHLHFGWPISHIIFGEKYDVLFVNDDIIPVIYLETKRPGRGLVEIIEFEERILSYEFSTLKYGILTDGFKWLKYDVIRQEKYIISLESPISYWEDFIRNLQSYYHLNYHDRGVLHE